jgi:SAM-dependent methyltransferase
MTATPFEVIGGYRQRARFAAAETRAVPPPRLLRGLLRTATHVAELPCGAGHFLSAYAERTTDVTLVDACEDMLALAVDQALAHGLPARRVTAHCALVQELSLPAGVDLVVMPNAALNQLASQFALSDLVAAVRDAVQDRVTVLAQVSCIQPNNSVDPSTFYDDRRPHGRWFPDAVLDGEVQRRRQQHRDGDELRIEFDYRDQTGRRLQSAEIELTLFTAEELIGVFTKAGFTDVRFLRSTGGLSEITAVAGTGAAR